MIKEVTRAIKAEVTRELWARAAGRCQFDGHNELLYKSPITQEKVNIAQQAHIYSFSPKGPRGRGDLEKTPEKLNNVENLMLMCHSCHTLIDKDKNGEKYSAELLKRWKRNHEKRILIVTGISPNKKSNVVFYTSKISEQNSIITQEEAVEAIFPNYYPTSENPIRLSMSSSLEDDSTLFWETESSHLKSTFSKKIENLMEEQKVNHFSVFALAPMPLLILLGALFTDKISVDVYQLFREPKGWKWQNMQENFKFILNEPSSKVGKPVLIISISDKIKFKRITDILGENVSIWELTVPSKLIGNDNIRSKAQLSLIRNEFRKIMSMIKKNYDLSTSLSIFPAMSVSCSVELGRIRMPKAEMPWVIYDQNNKSQKFIKTIKIGG